LCVWIIILITTRYYMYTSEHMMRTFVVSGVIAALTTVGIAGGAWWYFTTHSEAYPRIVSPDPSTAQVSTTSDSAVVAAVRRANPAVVAITVSKDVPKYEQYLERVPAPFGGFFGEEFFYEVPRMREQGTERQDIGGGSGFLVSHDGLVVTNRHVVADIDAEYTVFTNDGEKHTARVIARDPHLDLAVLDIEGDTYEYLTFGDSDSVQLGQTVIAIGNALAEFRNTVSVGVVSGLARSITASDGRGSAEVLDHLIQTDAGINEGNSGGPLLDVSGKVIGVSVAMASGAENIGFALSANSVKGVVASVQETGEIVRPYLGVRYVPITPLLRERNGLTIEYGVIVLRGDTVTDLAVLPGSPADKAGIRENDVLLEVDGVRLVEGTSLGSIIAGKKVGDTVEIRLLRAGEEHAVSVLLTKMPTE
jgi:serine protease Do